MNSKIINFLKTSIFKKKNFILIFIIFIVFCLFGIFTISSKNNVINSQNTYFQNQNNFKSSANNEIYQSIFENSQKYENTAYAENAIANSGKNNYVNRASNFNVSQNTNNLLQNGFMYNSISSLHNEIINNKSKEVQRSWVQVGYGLGAVLTCQIMNFKDNSEKPFANIAISLPNKIANENDSSFTIGFQNLDYYTSFYLGPGTTYTVGNFIIDHSIKNAVYIGGPNFNKTSSGDNNTSSNGIYFVIKHDGDVYLYEYVADASVMNEQGDNPRNLEKPTIFYTIFNEDDVASGDSTFNFVNNITSDLIWKDNYNDGQGKNSFSSKLYGYLTNSDNFSEVKLLTSHLFLPGNHLGNLKMYFNVNPIAQESALIDNTQVNRGTNFSSNQRIEFNFNNSTWEASFYYYSYLYAANGGNIGSGYANNSFFSKYNSNKLGLNVDADSLPVNSASLSLIMFVDVTFGSKNSIIEPNDLNSNTTFAYPMFDPTLTLSNSNGSPYTYNNNNNLNEQTVSRITWIVLVIVLFAIAMLFLLIIYFLLFRRKNVKIEKQDNLKK